MFHPLPLFIGLRYVRSRSRGFFVSFISWISMLGICVGVAALITIISVMNGLEGEMRTRLLSLASHATLAAGPGADAPTGRALAERVRERARRRRRRAVPRSAGHDRTRPGPARRA